MTNLQSNKQKVRSYKKWWVWLIVAVALLTACTSDKTNEVETKVKDVPEIEKVEKVESKYPYPIDSEVVGDSKIIVDTAAGSSEDGNIPVLIVASDTMLDSIGLELENFDGSVETFIYIKEIFNDSMQVGAHSMTTLSLVEDFLNAGVYEVVAVQFENNDPESGNVVNLAKAQYEVKRGS